MAGPPVVALAGALVLLAFALSGPYLLVPILSFAFALVAFVAMGASG